MSPTLAARHARVQRIRRAVSAATVAIFLALFATIYIQMAAGKDPVLGSATSISQVSSTSTPSSSSTSTSSSSADDSSSSSSMTTAQS